MHEDALLVRLKEVVPADVSVSVVADRGIADCKLFEFLEVNYKVIQSCDTRDRLHRQ